MGEWIWGIEKFKKPIMSQVVQLDTTTILIKNDNENALAEIIDSVSAKDKRERVRSFQDFTSKNKILGENYQFNRDECYDRYDVHCEQIADQKHFPPG